MGDLEYRTRVIAHIHTDASNGPASEIDPVIGDALKRIFGPQHRPRWKECFTKVERLARLLNDPMYEPRIGIITVTDHLNNKSHTLSEQAIRLASKDHRLAVCGEVSCVEPDTDGVCRRSPEVLIYGRPEPVEGPFGSYFGLSQETVDEIFDTCKAEDSEKVQTSKVIDYCKQRGLAYALAHPMDGQHVKLETILGLVCESKFVETINGGFPASTATYLASFLEFHERIYNGWTLPAELARKFPMSARLAQKIVSNNLPPPYAWGGSDAHSHNFARVVVVFRTNRPRPKAGDLFDMMLNESTKNLTKHEVFKIEGRSGSTVSVLDDVLRIVARNIWEGRKHYLKIPSKTIRLMSETRRITAQELGKRAKIRAMLLEQANRELPLKRILASMVPPQAGLESSARHHHMGASCGRGNTRIVTG